MLRSRHEILSMLQSSAFSTGVSILNDGPGHRLRVQYQRGETNRPFDCVVLVRSSQWFRYRLNVFAELDGIEMVICARHDSCLPVPVWSVEEARVYNPGETAVPLSTLLDVKVRGSKYGHLLFIAAILSGHQEALDALAQLPRSTRYRIQAQVRAYANLRPGNKLKIV
jgi:hypothetical protein